MKHLAVLIMMGWLGCTTGCKNKDGLPYGILGKQKMQEVFWDMMQAEVFTNQFIKKDSSKNANLANAGLQQQIFFIHQITREEFYKSYRYYSVHSELMRPLLDSITAIAEKDKYKILYGKPDGPVRLPIPSLLPVAVPDPKYIPMPVPTTAIDITSSGNQTTYIPN